MEIGCQATTLAAMSLIDVALLEDIGPGDVTSRAVFPEDARLTAKMVAREAMVLAGLPIAEDVFKRLDPDALISSNFKDGDAIEAGTAIMDIEGNAAALLSAERTALNFLQHLSGIATLTRRYVDLLTGTDAKLLDTRKTLPGYRQLAKYATRMGGAKNHRMGLYDAVMIKDNHVSVAGSLEIAVKNVRTGWPGPIQVECDTLEQVAEALNAGVESILLDNMSLKDLTDAVELASGSAELEASGGVTLETIRDIAKTGVDYISVGRLTQSAPAIDIGLDYSD